MRRTTILLASRADDTTRLFDTLKACPSSIVYLIRTKRLSRLDADFQSPMLAEFVPIEVEYEWDVDLWINALSEAVKREHDADPDAEVFVDLAPLCSVECVAALMVAQVVAHRVRLRLNGAVLPVTPRITLTDMGRAFLLILNSLPEPIMTSKLTGKSLAGKRPTKSDIVRGGWTVTHLKELGLVRSERKGRMRLVELSRAGAMVASALSPWEVDPLDV